MSINLVNNKSSLQSAWEDVLNEKTPTNWALFGYEGLTNVLKVVSKGSEGIDEMVEDLSSGKIMYAFIGVKDPKTSLPKFVLLNWQGEGADTVRKGLCVNHVRDVSNFFKGAHLTINARNEEEVEAQRIIEKVASSTGSAYSFKARTEPIESTGPVGTAYQRVNPVKEINSKARDQFWQEAEQEEKRRKEEEKRRIAAEKVRLEEELREREMKEATEREAKDLQRNNALNEAQQAASKSKAEAPPENGHADEPELPRVDQAELIKRQRSQEAQQLISQRTVNARLIFEQNSTVTKTKWAPEKPVRASLNKAAKKPDLLPETKPADDSPTDEDSDQFSTIKRSPKDLDKKNVANDLVYETAILQKEFEIQETKKAEEVKIEHITEQQLVDEVVYQEFEDGPGIQAKAIYDYQAADDTEISFDPGDVITNIDKIDEGWWQGLGPDGTYGLFPANYVELVQ